MKIAHLTTVHPRFDTRIYVNECKSLAEKYGQDFFLIVADGKGDETKDGVQILDIGKLSGGRIGRVIIGFWRALRMARKIKADILHFHDSELMLLGVFLSMLGCRVVYDVHEDIAETIKTRKWLPIFLKNPVSIIMLFLEKTTSIFFAAIVTVTPKISLKFPKSKTVLVRNYPRISELEVAVNIPYSDRLNIFTCVGVVTKRRSVVEMVTAFSEVPLDYKAKLVLTGIFRPDDLQSEIATLTGWENTEFKGWGYRKDVAKRLAEARAGIVLCHPDPNHMTAYPVKLYEYMAAGLPIIASDFPAWRKQIEGIDCALFVDPENPSAIAEAIIWIIEHPDEAELMGEKGQKAVIEKYNWDIESSKLINMYKELLIES